MTAEMALLGSLPARQEPRGGDPFTDYVALAVAWWIFSIASRARVSVAQGLTETPWSGIDAHYRSPITFYQKLPVLAMVNRDIYLKKP